MTTDATDLPTYLERWAASGPERDAPAAALFAFAEAAALVAAVVRKPGCGDDPAKTRAEVEGLLVEALAPHAAVLIGDVGTGRMADDAPDLAAVVQPLTNHDKLDFNGPLGTIFSLVSITEGAARRLDDRGLEQRAAAIVSYGARTALALTVGQGTHLFDLDPETRRFVRAKAEVRVPAKTNRYAINSSYQHNWNLAIRDYVNDLMARNEGPMAKPISLHWTNSLVLETFQVLTRGGVCMYPSEGPRDCMAGCVGRIEEANPIAWLVEQAGGEAIDGVDRLLDFAGKSPTHRTPFIFGAREEVELVARYCRAPSKLGTDSPLFGVRGFFRR